MRRRLAPLAALAFALASAPPAAAAAQEAATGAAPPGGRPVRLIVPFPAGGSIDLMSRLLAEALQPRLGRQVVVENRAGAGGNLGAEVLARAAPDGETLGALPANVFTINRHVYRRLPFDPDADLAALGLFAAFPSVLLAANGYPPRDLAELARATRAGGPPPACGAPGAGTTPHLALVLLMREAGAACTVVHYRGTGPAMPDLQTGKIQLYVDTALTGLAAARDGRARALAVTSARRLPLAPEVPAAAETVPGFEVSAWLALAGPRGLPGPAAARLEAAVVGAARDPAVAARLEGLGAEPLGTGAAELAARIREERARWGPVVRAAGVTAE
jgi:tripartite-type tricarboxylate transporter receptor subunit TctC